jgi:predicted dehydrogenase
VCVVDPDLGRARDLAGKHRGANALTSLQAVQWRDRVDVAHVCTPVHTHEQAVRTLIESGVHVLVEKPVTPSAPETTELLERARTLGVMVCPVHQFLFQAGVATATRALSAIGPIVHLEYAACSAGAAHDASTSDDVAADILPHPLSLSRRLLGGRLADFEWLVVRPREGELRVIGRRAGVSLAALISMHGRPTESGFRVIGESGTVVVDLFHGFAVRLPGTVSRLRKIAAPFADSGRLAIAAGANLTLRTLRREAAYPGLRSLVAAVYHAVERGGASPILPDETIDVAIARDRILRAAAE